MELALIWFGIAIVTAFAASARGRSGIFWFFMGLLVSIFATLAVLVLPSRKVIDGSQASP
jgi:hypothetical protein